MKKSIVLIWIAILLFSFSCEKKSVGPITQKPTFTIYGAVIKDLNLSKDIAYFTVSRNDTLFDGATVKVGSRTIPSIGSGSYFSNTLSFPAAMPYIDSIISAQDTVTITFGFTLPDTFSANVTPIKDTFTIAEFPIYVNWTGSDSATGYIVSVAKGDSIPGAALYSVIVPTSDGTQAPIPVSTVKNTADELVTGYYWIYVIAYNKSFPTYPGIPFNLPAGLPANNISGAQGTIGAGVIAQKAVIFVTTLP
jgi:hypothetical protein